MVYLLLAPNGTLNLDCCVENAESSMAFERDLLGGIGLDALDFWDCDIRSSKSL